MGVSEEEKSSLLLDEKLLCFMEQLELLEAKRATLNSLIEQGWFSISKARYSMGNKRVSALQYASEIEPLVYVHARTQDNSKIDFCTERLAQQCNKDSNKDQRSVEDIGPREEGVRRRNKPKKTEKDTCESAGSEKSPEIIPVHKSGQNPQQDPLKWFGILVPQSLKQAQMSFNQVIELSAEIATLQAAVLNIRKELKLSMSNKRTSSERLSCSVGQDGKLHDSIDSEQEEAKEEHQATDSQ